LIEQDPTYGYLALFATETTTQTSSRLSGPRNLAIVRVHRSNYSVDPALPDTLTVTVGSTQRVNRLRWLTNYDTASMLHADRPKLVGIGNDRISCLWEQWRVNQTTQEFQGVYGMRINAQGEILAPAALLTNAHHLHRGDDAFRLGDGVAWMTAVKPEDHKQRLLLHAVDASLRYTVTTILLPLATLQGTVTGVDGAQLQVLQSHSLAATPLPRPTPTASISLQPAPGVYTVSVTAWPYRIVALPNVTTGAGFTTVVDAQLTPLQPPRSPGHLHAFGSEIPSMFACKSGPPTDQFRRHSGQIRTPACTPPRSIK
jgi:hypothetical protein